MLLNRVAHINDYLDEVNFHTKMGATVTFEAITAQQERNAIMQKYPWGIGHLVCLWVYLWHNVCPKLRITRNFYFLIAGERRRTYSRTEILGRICRAGFRIVKESDRETHLIVTAERISNPLSCNKSDVSPIIHLNRIGKDGVYVKVYKFRTMHSYAQYLQQYVYERNNLREGGKLANDFRINIWGKMMRPIWLDELPMLWNVFRGDMKWVGVRPLSEHYFSLYTPEMQKLRIQVKPGLLPPFYYEENTPKDINEVQASERRYIEAYLQAPFKTDFRYFWGTVCNIIMRRKHSH